MPPTLALILTLGFIGYLFRRDIREKPNITGALWLALIWMFLVATRPVSKWLAVFGIHGFGTIAAAEGNSVDASTFSLLIVTAICILVRRQVSLSRLIREHPWITVFVLYCFLAIFWSDFPFSSFKRWIKVLGQPVMAVLLFTEPDWEEALIRLVKRCTYVFFPVSILWMKYFPHLGRHASEFGGMTNVGIAETKNTLGGISCILILFFIWHLLKVWKWEKGGPRRDELRLLGGLILMGVYCLLKAHSANATMSLLLAGAVMMALGLRFVDKRTIGAYALAAVIVLGIAQLTFDIYGKFVELSGHSTTIQGRGVLWEYLLQTDKKPLLGAGFESYWLGEQIPEMYAMRDFAYRPNQAHNGYLELYLNLGIVGLFIFLSVILAAFKKIRRELLENFEWGRFEIGCFLAILAHNWTEAAFKGLSFPFFVFFIISISYRRSQRSDSRGPDLLQECQPELVYS
jgi:O-antigen ligase